MPTSPVPTPSVDRQSAAGPFAVAPFDLRDALVDEPGNLLAGEGWRDFGACNGMELDLFFPERGESTVEAKAACADCIVATECLEYALDHNERYGIWGGTSGRERRRLRRDRAVAAA